MAFDGKQGKFYYRFSLTNAQYLSLIHIYNGSGAEIPGVVTRGIDVSEWQGKINWQKVKNSDIDFAFIRISSGTDYMDKYYDYNMSSANEADLPVGTYVYSKATTTLSLIHISRPVL